LDFTEIPDPDLSLQAATKDGLKCYKRQTLQTCMQQMTLLTPYAKEVILFIYFLKKIRTSEKNMVAFMLSY